MALSIPSPLDGRFTPAQTLHKAWPRASTGLERWARSTPAQKFTHHSHLPSAQVLTSGQQESLTALERRDPGLARQQPDAYWWWVVPQVYGIQLRRW